MFSVPGNFIGDFKTGDNIKYNLQVLEFLYGHYENAGWSERRLRKPITITLVSIIEAILHELHFRATHYTREGVANLASDVVSYMQGKTIDNLSKYIASAKLHNLFQTTDGRFYENLDELRKLRNKIHIQNWDELERDEHSAFTDSRKLLAEKALEFICKFLSHHHPRSPSLAENVGSFEFPWPEHFRTNADTMQW